MMNYSIKWNIQNTEKGSLTWRYYRTNVGHASREKCADTFEKNFCNHHRHGRPAGKMNKIKTRRWDGEMSETYCLTLLTIYYVTHDSNWTGGGVLIICFKWDTTHYLWAFPAETHKRSRIKASHTSSNDLKLNQTEHTCKLFPWAISWAMMMILPLSY